MSRILSGACATFALGSAFAVAAIAVGVIAQEPADPARVEKKPESGQENKQPNDTAKKEQRTSLFMFVKANDQVNLNILQRTLTQGAEVAKCKCGAPRVTPIPSFFYNEMEALTQGLEIGKTLGDRGSDLERLPAREELWYLPWTEKTRLLKEVRLTINKDKPVIVVMGAEPKDGYSLQEHGRQGYSLQLPQGVTPKSYKAVYAEVGKPDGELAEKSWPADAAQHFLVVLPDFSGDREALFNTIRVQKGVKQLVANPFNDVAANRDVLMVFAKINAQLTEGDGFDGNDYVPVALAPPMRSPERVWLLFPLTPEEAEKKATELQGLSNEKLQEELWKEPVKPGDDLIIDKDTKPRWIQLTDEGKTALRFSRRIPIKDFADLARKYPEAAQIRIYDFSKDEKKVDPIVVIGNREFGIRKVENWPNFLNQRAAAAKTGSAAGGVPPAGGGDK